MQGELREALAAIGIAQRKVPQSTRMNCHLMPLTMAGTCCHTARSLEHSAPDMLQFHYEGFLPPYFEVNELPKEMLRERYRGWNEILTFFQQGKQ